MANFPFYPFSYHNYYNYYPRKRTNNYYNSYNQDSNINRNEVKDTNKSTDNNVNNNENKQKRYIKRSSKNTSFANININGLLQSDLENPIIEILGIKLYLDDLIIISLLFFLYKEDVHDEILFGILILLLLN